MLGRRLLFGTLMIAVLFAVFLVDQQVDRMAFAARHPGLVLFVITILLVVWAGLELAAMMTARGMAVDRPIVVLAGVTGVALMFLLPRDAAAATALFASAAGSLWLVSLVRLAARRRTDGTLSAAGATLFALVYLGLLPGFYMLIRHDHSGWIVAAIILVTKCCDIGAYATGRLIGRHKLIPWLSPGKTWEGLAGGVVLSGVAALGAAALFNALQTSIDGLAVGGYWEATEAGRTFVPVRIPLLAAAGAGVLIGLLGQVGDLAASMIKRDAGLKDSGGAVPGFGGILDVLDSPILIAPFAYWLLLLLRNCIC
ncbi:MAG: hypothetical protein CMJ18_23085 [Phycisphaeraceae bacterium]|nr:hypothetical protein [Phycisphaeraceae bacterium]